jgi:hypothetical protein
MKKPEELKADLTKLLGSEELAIKALLYFERQIGPWIGPFICGATENGPDGLPEYIQICPTYGLSGSCPYKKNGVYSEPEW